MFNLQGGEIVMIMLLALVVLGPEKLPDAIRKAGKAYAELKKMSSSFQHEFRSVVDEPMREMRETARLMKDAADFTNGDGSFFDEVNAEGHPDPSAVEPDFVDFADEEPIE